MPEALAVLAVFLVCVVIYVIAKVQARNPELQKPAAQLAQLNEQRAWLEERLRRAERENWGNEMRQSIVRQLEETMRKVADMNAN